MYVCVCMYIYIYIYIHVYTHTHVTHMKDLRALCGDKGLTLCASHPEDTTTIIIVIITMII